MQATKYSSRVIVDHADRLLARADAAVPIYAIGGALLGALCGAIVAVSLSLSRLWPVVVGAGVVGLAGYLLGRRIELELQLQAHTALCQVAIEENTRRAVSTLDAQNRQ